jgi:IS30 family transposase
MSAQLTLAQRAILAELLKGNCPKREISCQLGVHRSTVDRGLKRPTGPIGYLYEEAQQRTDIRPNRAGEHENSKMSGAENWFVEDCKTDGRPIKLRAGRDASFLGNFIVM